MALNPDADEDLIEQRIEKLKEIKNKQVGIIELDHTLDIDTVTEIFIRINQKGVVLSNADFVMSKIASDEVHGGNKLSKLDDYFCRLIVDKDFNKHIVDNDSTFTSTDYYPAQVDGERFGQSLRARLCRRPARGLHLPVSARQIQRPGRAALRT